MADPGTVLVDQLTANVLATMSGIFNLQPQSVQGFGLIILRCCYAVPVTE